MLKGSAAGSSMGAKAPEASQAAYRRGSAVLGSKVLSSMAVAGVLQARPRRRKPKAPVDGPAAPLKV